MKTDIRITYEQAQALMALRASRDAYLLTLAWLHGVREKMRELNDVETEPQRFYQNQGAIQCLNGVLAMMENPHVVAQAYRESGTSGFPDDPFRYQQKSGLKGIA